MVFKSVFKDCNIISVCQNCFSYESIKDILHNSYSCRGCIGISLQHYLACKGSDRHCNSVEGFIFKGYSNLKYQFDRSIVDLYLALATVLRIMD